MGTRVRSRGLILLVVLGMLSLFSLLAVTFVVFSGQSRVASLQMAGRDFRGTPSDRLLDQAIKQVVRGTVDTDSALWGQSLLEDLYGAFETPIKTTARVSAGGPYPQGFNRPPLPIPVGAAHGPKLYSGTTGQQFLKIPLEWSSDLPLHHDALTGRVITFLDGPLANQSLRIVRYIGAIDTADLQTYDSIRYSVLVDLSEIKDRVTSVALTTTPATVMTLSVDEWIQNYPATLGGAQLLYRGTTGTLTNPYTIMINAAPQNGPGMGITATSSLTGTTVSAPFTHPFLIARAKSPPPANELKPPFKDVEDALLPNFSQKNLVTRYGQTYSPVGDTDEPYDAADFNNFFMSLRRAAAASSDDVTPAFHRPEVINYLAALDSGKLNLSSLTPEQFLSFLELVQRASARPLSYRITRFPDEKGNPITLRSNARFTGSTPIESNGGLRTPQLHFDWEDRLTKPEPQAAFDAWLRWNLRGSWDVDNDGDGVKDSVWVDLNYPLSTAPDGKLLKVLAAFYIEDMGGKIDINAAGSQIQAADSTFPLTLGGTGYAYRPNTSQPSPWPQGLGFGTGDIYLRHLFDNEQHHSNVMQWRYDGKPGIDSVDDLVSQLLAHHSSGSAPNFVNKNVMRPSRPSNARLPGLPVSTHGRLGIALDLLGNPILMDTTAFFLEEEIDDPYEARVLSEGKGQRGISFAEWERLVRFSDLDRSSLPADLELQAGGSWSVVDAGGTTNANFLNRVRSISPRNVTLNTPRFTRTYSVGSTTRRVSSFVEFVEEYIQRRSSAGYPAISNAAMRRLFPVEFTQNLPLNLNRPLGNGIDDDNDGQVDEPAELAANNYTNLGSSTELDYGGTSNARGDYLRDSVYLQGAWEFDPKWDPRSATTAAFPTEAQFQQYSGSRSRQLLARHLYCLAQLILPVDSSQKNAYIFPNQPTATAVDNETRARILAQWAVNVVDFADADGAMTRFSYDPDPFFNSSGSLAPDWQPDGTNVVFGFEHPELLITESLATHDTRIRRRDPPDQGYDQMRVPEGSLFLEFLCPRSTAFDQGKGDDLLPGLPPSLYGTNAAGSFALDLTKTTSDGTNTYPVWRVLLLEPNVNGSLPATDAMTSVYEVEADSNGDQDPNKIGLRAFNYSYQVGNSPSGLKWRVSTATDDGTGLSPVIEPKVDRVLWFTDPKVLKPNATNVALPGLSNPEAKVYSYRLGATPLLQGGQYLVVGPRPVTYFGSKNSVDGQAPRPHRPNNHRIELLNNWVQIWKQDNTPAFWGTNTAPTPAKTGATSPLSNFVHPCLTMVAGAEMPVAWPSATSTPPDPDITQTYVGLNISEPTPDAYYPPPTVKVSTDNTDDPDNAAPAYDKLSKDGYIDLNSSSAVGSKEVFDGGPSSAHFLHKHSWPVSTVDAYPRPQTQKNWSAAVLQRLADPERPWHEALNPYITVDWHSIDLTVFSGEDTVDEEGELLFATRAKSGQHTKVTIPAASGSPPRTRGPLGETFYSYETTFPTAETADGSGAGTVFFTKELLSEWYEDQTSTAPEQTRGVATSQFASLGYLNRSFGLRGYTNTSDYTHSWYVGAPSRTPDAPFFPNRNYVSALELANVPISGAGTFMQEFYFEPNGATPLVPRHRHTLDFEQVLGTAGSVPKRAAELLEVVGVPSPWPDAWNVANPKALSVPPADLAGTALLDPYQAPFNFIPTYREPGRINLNTVTEPTVARGLMGNIMAPNDRTASGATVPYVQQLNTALTANLSASPSSVLDSRVPAAMQPSGNPHLSAASPTQYPGVFTSTTGGYLFPLTTLQRVNPIDTTLFRRAEAIPPASPTSNKRALDPALLTSISPGGVPINNSFTFNYPATRLANMTTDRSNVFAVRVTLAYFEYSPENGLGIEYGSEQGTSRRNRAFYLIDRSIPVGFQSGTDWNTENCILVRRIIE